MKNPFKRLSAALRPSHRDSPAQQHPASRPQRARSLSACSTSSYSSDYSTETTSLHEDEAFSESDRSTTKTRPGVPSPGSNDRRRVAIVQMEALSESGTNSSASSIRSRRGLPSSLAGLALVAPPDASSMTYTHLTPPLTVPATEEKSHHARSASEDLASSRDDTQPPTINNSKTNSINNPSVPSSSTTRPAGRPVPAALSHESSWALLSPPGVMSSQRSAFSSAFATPIITPEIGASKEIHVPVAAPVVVDLASKDAVQTRAPSSNSPVKPKMPSSGTAAVDPLSVPAPGPFDPVLTSGFVNYKPGLHATAGPLPPPPQTRFDMINLRTPPPPRPPRLHSPAPPKLKSDLQAMKQALQLPPSVEAKLAKTSVTSGAATPATTTRTALGETKPLRVASKRGTDKTVSDSKTEDLPLLNTQPTHRREGAFTSTPVISEKKDLASSVSSAESSYSDVEPTPRPIVDDNDESVPNVTVIEEEDTPKAAETIEEREQEDSASSLSLSSPSKSKHNHNDRSSWIEGRSIKSPSLESGARVSFEDERPSPRSSLSRSSSVSPRSSRTGPAPSPPPKSFRNSLTTGLKRFSTLPKGPARSLSLRSVSSGSTSAQQRRSSGGAHQGYSSSRTPSPSISYSRRAVAPGKRKIIDFNPPAMFCHEVHQQRTTAERCAIYAAKINELYIHDCGLGDWVVEMRFRTSHPQPRGPSTKPFAQQPRHTSGSSMISDSTFPRRPDASTATDLSSRSSRGQPSPYHEEASPIPVPVSLPYPSLANQQRQQSIRSTATSSSAGTPPSSVRSLAPSGNLSTVSKTGGFFASLGRKASLNTSTRRDRGGLTPAHSNGSRAVLSKPPPTTATTPTKDMISKPLHITSQHSAPSGPRALASSKSMRVQRSQTLMSPISPSYLAMAEKDEALGRRPSLFDMNSESGDRGYASDYHGGRNALEIPNDHHHHPDPEFAAQVERLHNVLPHADRAVLAGYLRRAGQDVLAIGQYLEDEKNGTLKF
ncbi:hypothetical protein H1R20_g10894, partial [Candolleomyces eurysporus]